MDERHQVEVVDGSLWTEVVDISLCMEVKQKSWMEVRGKSNDGDAMDGVTDTTMLQSTREFCSDGRSDMTAMAL